MVREIVVPSTPPRTSNGRNSGHLRPPAVQPGPRGNRLVAPMSPQPPTSPKVPLLRKGEEGMPMKPQTCFGYLPLWSECVPLSGRSGALDWPGLLANVGSGLVIGMREVLGGIVSASLMFSTSGDPALLGMFPFGIGLVWFSTSMGALWYAIFGRMQYVYGTAQDVIGILQAVSLARIAEDLRREGLTERIPATTIAFIGLSSVLTGICSLLMGKLGLGKLALLFPAPVTNGFLGAIGFVILRSSLQTSSGVKFQQFYPVDFDDFCDASSLAQVGLQVATVVFIRAGPVVMRRLCFPRTPGIDKLTGVVSQLLPLILFHVVAFCAGISMKMLTKEGWVYPKEKSGGMLNHWTQYSMSDVDPTQIFNALPDMPAIVLMAVLCTTTGALTVSDRFPRGPPGDPAPMEALDFDKELTTVGVSSILLGLTGGTLTFHTFTSIQLRLDGGTHRIAVFAVSMFVFLAFASGFPFGHYIPKWYLSGLFMNTAFHFLKGALLSYKNLPPAYFMGRPGISGQYIITLSCVLTSVFASPANAIFIGVVMSIGLFLVQSARTSPVINVVKGSMVVSRTKRPFWEMQVLHHEGHRILLLYLQGQLFFGSARRLVAVLAAATAGEQVQYCILSFARVSRVDPSAARHLKSMQDKAALSGCKLICCRTNHSVFDALVAAEVIVAPDDDLVQHLRGFRWIAKPTNDGNGVSHGPAAFGGDPEAAQRVHSPPSSRLVSWSPAPGLEEPDAFAHETDALDYCDEEILQQFCYSDQHFDRLKPHMMEYRRSCKQHKRLEEWAFEEMNNLRRGIMHEVRGYCDVYPDLKKWDKVPDSRNSLCFILRGSISLVQMLDRADQDFAEPQIRGFSFRQGKRLRRRYPPGHVVGKVAFFLAGRGQALEAENNMNVVVSSKLGDGAEVWVLQHRKWESIPDRLKAELTKMLCEQLADDAQHAQIQEH